MTSLYQLAIASLAAAVLCGLLTIMMIRLSQRAGHRGDWPRRLAALQTASIFNTLTFICALATFGLGAVLLFYMGRP